MRLTKTHLIGGAAATAVAVLASAALYAAAGDDDPAPLPNAPVEQVEPFVPQLTLAGEMAGAPMLPGMTLRVTAANGTLEDLTVMSGEGQSVAGDLADGVWTADAPAASGSSYSVTATVVNADGVRATATQTFSTLAESRILTASIAPVENEVVGVGMPIIVHFNRDVTDRAAVQRRMSVQDSHSSSGAWHWYSDREVHYRPKVYWQPGNKVTVKVALAGFENSPGTWGKDTTRTFSVGDSVISYVDVSTYRMKTYINGQLVRDMAISGGAPRWPTRNGTHIALEKFVTKVMDSSTVGIGGADAYRTRVAHAVRMTNSGTFTHGAPWSVSAQGRRNVSHGCINMAPGDAKWFHDLTRRGDIIVVNGSNVGPRLYDAGVRNWSVSWADWIKGSAVPVADVDGPPAPTWRSSGAAAPAPTAPSPVGTPAPPSAKPSPSTAPSAAPAPVVDPLAPAPDPSTGSTGTGSSSTTSSYRAP